MGLVTETLENTATFETSTTPENRNRLYRALAWVGIAAGSLFIVATVFFSGYVLGQHGGGGMHHGPHRMMLKPFPGPDGPMRPGGPMGPDDGPRAERLVPPSAPPSVPPRP
jgi:hypothetical protein